MQKTVIVRCMHVQYVIYCISSHCAFIHGARQSLARYSSVHNWFPFRSAMSVYYSSQVTGYSSWIWEVLILRDLDWLSRHDRFYSLRSRTMDATARRMPPDLLLKGTHTGQLVKSRVIALPDKKPPRQSLLTEKFAVLKKRSIMPVKNTWSNKKFKQTILRFECHRAA